jgi:hypothetical protein
LISVGQKYIILRNYTHCYIQSRDGVPTFSNLEYLNLQPFAFLIWIGLGGEFVQPNLIFFLKKNQVLRII